MLTLNIFFMATILILIVILLLPRKKQSFIRIRKQLKQKTQSNAKPPWVRQEIIRIKAHARKSGCRAIADIFNRRFAAKRSMTVGKSYVANTLRMHMADVLKIRQRWKHRIPRIMNKNSVWGIDLTGVTDSNKKMHNLLGVIDHGTRKCLALKMLRDKASITLLKALILMIEMDGKPQAIRTDNEAIFTSRIFRFGLWLLGITHQRSMPHCPWQNGRVERFFGTFKQIADSVTFNAKHLQHSLNEFAFWYNHVRPHRHLNGQTPDEAWCGTNPYKQPPKFCRKYSAWKGMLTGYWLEYG